MSFLASDVMDAARVLLNDTLQNLYTNTVLLPLVSRANEELEKNLILFGAPVQRVTTTPITVAANVTNLTLPSDFLLPIDLNERASGSSDDWTPMVERIWDPNNYVPSTVLAYWAFRNNQVVFAGSTVARDVQLRYERQLAVISGANSPEDFVLSKAFLSAKTAEFAARYIGMNTGFADALKSMEVDSAEDDLMRLFVLQGQGISQRRRRFRTRSNTDNNVMS